MRARPKIDDYDNEPILYTGKKLLVLEDLEQWADEAEQEIKELKDEIKAPPFDWEFAARQFDADVLSKAMEIVKEEPSVTPVKNKRWLEIKALWDISDYLQTNYLKK